MLKETENEETRLFCQIFVIGSILIGEVWARDGANTKKCIRILRRVRNLVRMLHRAAYKHN